MFKKGLCVIGLCSCIFLVGCGTAENPGGFGNLVEIEGYNRLYYDEATSNVYFWNGAMTGVGYNDTTPSPYLDSTGLKPYKYDKTTGEIYESEAVSQ